jgi:hypothetical protein
MGDFGPGMTYFSGETPQVDAKSVSPTSIGYLGHFLRVLGSEGRITRKRPFLGSKMTQK